jgi:hypothetical protein
VAAIRAAGHLAVFYVDVDRRHEATFVLFRSFYFRRQR